MRRGFVQKRCPKCGGNIYLDRDLYGWYEECLQCCHTRFLETIVEVARNSRDNLRQIGGNRPCENAEAVERCNYNYPRTV